MFLLVKIDKIYHFLGRTCALVPVPKVGTGTHWTKASGTGTKS